MYFFFPRAVASRAASWKVFEKLVLPLAPFVLEKTAELD